MFKVVIFKEISQPKFRVHYIPVLLTHLVHHNIRKLPS